MKLNSSYSSRSMRWVSRTNLLRSQDRLAMQCYNQNLTGHLCRKHCIFSQCRGCGNRCGSEWQRRSRIALGSWSGELEPGIYQTGTERCQKTGVEQFTRQSARVTRHHSNQSVSESATLWEIGGRFGRCIFTANQHSASSGVRGDWVREYGKNFADVDALWVVFLTG